MVQEHFMSVSEIDGREVAARFEVVKALYGPLIELGDLETVRNRIETAMRSVAALDSVALDLVVEPFSVFVPESSEG
jgi:hypothetical protein